MRDANSPQCSLFLALGLLFTLAVLLSAAAQQTAPDDGSAAAMDDETTTGREDVTNPDADRKAPSGKIPSTVGNESNTALRDTSEPDIKFVEPDETNVASISYEPNYMVEFWSGSFKPEPGLDPAVTDTGLERTCVLIQFVASPYASTLDKLSSLGYRDIGRLSTTSRYAVIPVDEAEAIAHREEVRAVTGIRPEWKLRPSLSNQLAEMPADEEIQFAVQTFANLSVEWADELGLTSVDSTDGTATYYGPITPTEVRELQRNPRVLWIEKRAFPEPDVSEGRRLVGAHLAERPGIGSNSGYTGQGVRVGVLDTGVEFNHKHFSSVNIIHAKDWWEAGNPRGSASKSDPAGKCDHGTHVAGTIAGHGFDNRRNTQIRGVAPDADLVISTVMRPKNRDPGQDECEWVRKLVGPKRMFTKVNSKGAEIISNSWGHDTNGNYNIVASWVDTWAKNHPETLIVFSNGNAGERSHTGSPGVAKNVLTVGATRDGSRDGGKTTPGSVTSTNDNSSLNNIGPPTDASRGSGRQKPELYAPGHWITGPVNPGTISYDEKKGTSMAAPHVSGVAALMKEKYPNMDANQLRAELIGTAAEPRYSPGYGVVNANNALLDNLYESRHVHMSGALKKHHGLTLTKQAKQKKKRIENDKKSFAITQETERLVVTLTWLDPGNLVPSRSDRMANDIDLIVSGPNTRRKVTTDSNVKQVIVEDPQNGKWTIKLHASEVTVFTKQKYDVVYRTVTDKPILNVSESKSTTVQPWQPRKQQFTVSVDGEGAPVTGTYLTTSVDPGISECGGDWNATVIGVLSDGYDFSEDACVEVPLPSTKQTYSVDYTINTSNAERIDGMPTSAVSRSVTYTVLPPPDRDRFETGGANDDFSTATDVSRAVSWRHGHLRCIGGDRFRGGKPPGADCSSVLTNGDEVLAQERWIKGGRLDELSLHSDGDEDFYEFTLPSTDTPSLPNSECGTQKVQMGESEKEVKTEGRLVIQVLSTANSLGDAKARIAPPNTPINVYDDSGQPVTAGQTRVKWGSRLERIVPCPQSKGLRDLTVSFGEGTPRNLGAYEIRAHYLIDVMRVKEFEKAVKDRWADYLGVRRTLDNPWLMRPIEELFPTMEDFPRSCETHCGPTTPWPLGPPGGLLVDTERLLVHVRGKGGGIVNRPLLMVQDGEITAVRSVDNPNGVEPTMNAYTDVLTLNLLAAAEDKQGAMAKAYQEGLIRYEGQGFLDGLYVGGFTVDLNRDGSAVVKTRTVYDLSDEEEATTFEAVQRDESYLEELRNRYLMRMQWVADEWASRTDRKMTVSNPKISFDMRESSETGVLSMTVDWEGFAATTDEGLRVREPFASDFVTDQPLVFELPPGSDLQNASPEPNRIDEARVEWEAGTRMGDLNMTISKQAVPARPPSNVTVTLMPKAGAFLSGASSFGGVSEAVGSALGGTQSVLTYGGSVAVGSRNGTVNFRLTGMNTTGSLFSTTEGIESAEGSAPKKLLLLTGDLVLRPIPRLLVQPYAIAGAGARRLSSNMFTETGEEGTKTVTWDPAVQVGIGADLRFGDVTLGLEVADYLTGSTGSDGGLEHNAFVFVTLGVPIY